MKKQPKKPKKNLENIQQSTPEDIQAMVEYLGIQYENLALVTTVDILVAMAKRIEEFELTILGEKWKK